MLAITVFIKLIQFERNQCVFLRNKHLQSVIADTQKNTGLEKTLTGFDLILLGLGFIVGTGVFALTGMVAAKYAGPAVTVSYIIAGVTCVFVALAYTELAVMLPTSGSVYSYSYVAFGEIFAWLVCSAVVLELGIGAATVAGSWSAYVVKMLADGGIMVPYALKTVPADGGIVNLPAVIVTLIVGMFLYLGTKDSKLLNAVLVFIKMGAIFVFVIVAVPHFDATNLENFMPYGFDDVLLGSSILFFAFTGFGGLSAAAEECKNPSKDLIIGIIGSLVLSTLVYVLVAGLLVGITHYSELGNDALSYALSQNGSNIGSAIVTTGAICGMTTVLLMQLYTLARILYVVSRDGLLSKSFGKVHAKYHSPYITIMVLVLGVALLSGFCQFHILAKVSSMGAIIEYIAVILAVLLLRVKMPEIERKFRCPAIFVIAPLGLVACVYLLFKQIIDKNGNLMDTGEILIYWFLGMTILYFIRIAFMQKENV
ncbi:MAG UNVERIFIED_CONTAM: amino acid permease [Rickettsiaceae bacterium]|jgi:APA family basic amino acid/polyamine antiporter